MSGKRLCERCERNWTYTTSRIPLCPTCEREYENECDYREDDLDEEPTPESEDWEMAEFRRTHP